MKILDSGDPDWIFVDVRHPKESEHLVKKYANYLSIRYEEFRNRWEELPRDKKIALLCSTSRRSYEIARFLKSKGFRDVFVLNGGLNYFLKWGLEF